MKIVLKITAAVLAIVLLASCSWKINFDGKPAETTGTTEKETEIETGTTIEEVAGTDEKFNAAGISRLYYVSGGNTSGIEKTAGLAAELYNASGCFGKTVSVEYGAFSDKKTGDIVLVSKDELGDEDYETVVTPGNIYLYFSGLGRCNGLLYGLQDILKKVMTSEGGMIETGTEEQSPDTSERTLMLDMARKRWSVEWIKNLIAEMSWMGFNALELHLTEEQGIRADIWRDSNGKTVPDCNGNDFSFICGGTVVSWNKNHHENIQAKYSRDDLIDIIRCAEKYHIDIIPGVDFPGHSTNLIKRCNEKINSGGLSFSYHGNEYASDSATVMAANGSYSQTIQISSEFARNLSYAVTEAYASFFREFGCDRINICCDEVSVNDSSWNAYARENGGKTMFDGFIVYINSLSSMLKDMGYTVRAFNDYLFSSESAIALDPDLEICYWLDPSGSSYYGSAGHLVSENRVMYNCVCSYCYYALRQSSGGADARDKYCTQWTFHHATAERIFSGCGGRCGISGCRESGGWNPSKMWGYNCRDKTIVSGSNLGGGYFLIWGDWASWDDENNIFRREDDYGLVMRMWASSAKMIDFNASNGMSWNEFSGYTEKVKFTPAVSN